MCAALQSRVKEANSDVGRTFLGLFLGLELDSLVAPVSSIFLPVLRPIGAREDEASDKILWPAAKVGAEGSGEQFTIGEAGASGRWSKSRTGSADENGALFFYQSRFWGTRKGRILR